MDMSNIIVLYIGLLTIRIESPLQFFAGDLIKLEGQLSNNVYPHKTTEIQCAGAKSNMILQKYTQFGMMTVKQTWYCKVSDSRLCLTRHNRLMHCMDLSLYEVSERFHSNQILVSQDCATEEKLENHS